MVNKIISARERRKESMKFLEKLYYSRVEDGKEIDETAINRLILGELIEKIKYKKDFWFKITDKGIDLIENIHKEKKQEEFSKIIALTGSVLALVGIFGFLEKILSDNNFIGLINWIFAIVIIICFIPIFNFVIKSYFKVRSKK